MQASNWLRLIVSCSSSHCAISCSFSWCSVRLGVYLGSRLLGIGTRALIVAADEDLAVVVIGHGADALVHTVFCDHIVRQLRGPLQIVRSAGRNVVKLQLLRHAAAEEHDDAVAHLVSRGMERVLIRQADRQAEGIAARHNGDLVDRLLRGQEVCRNAGRARY